MQTEILIAGFGGQGVLVRRPVAGLCRHGKRQAGHLDPFLRPRNARRHRQLYGDHLR